MVDCSCYHNDINFIGERGVCWGTKEREPCSCGGDASKCDFYPTVREEEKKPTTNGDRIRAMTDEELAEHFTQFYYDGPKFYCPAVADVGEGACAANYDCRQCWLDWLKQEAGEEKERAAMHGGA